jgi:uncharacterized protein
VNNSSMQHDSAAADSALEFPCAFPVKAMGLNEEDFCDHVLQLLDAHSAHIDDRALQQQVSRTGRYISITLVVQAHSKAQLDAIYQLLSDDARVLVAL